MGARMGGFAARACGIGAGLLAGTAAVVTPTAGVAASNAPPATLNIVQDEGGSRSVLPLPQVRSPVIADPDLTNATPVYPQMPTPPEGAPNVVLIMTDDTGFGAASTFGGPVPTPNLDRLAARGLTYTRFHTTAMCSPSRAALLTGRNHHVAGTGALTDFASGFQGYSGTIPQETATIAEILKGNGYNTAFIGKHHNVPIGQTSLAGPFDQWPLGLGFEHFFGFIGAGTDQWRPNLIRDNSPVPPAPIGDILDKRLTDEAIGWIQRQQAGAPGKPFFLYYAPGSTHAPLQAPPDWIARFRGRFAQGYNRVREEILARQKALGIVPESTELAGWPDDLPRWNTLSADQCRIEERYMEVYAAMLAYQDDQLGRLLDELERMGLADNTLIIFIEGDNGSDAAGGPEGRLNESGEIANRRSTDAEKLAAIEGFGGPEVSLLSSAGWAFALDAPFPYYKQIASHLGGTRNGMVISWPAGIVGRGTRTQFGHVVDIAATILEATGISAPAIVNGVGQRPMDGVPLGYSFNNPDAPEQHRTQYFEILGNRAIYHDGWLASTTPLKRPWDMVTGADANMELSGDYRWELYDLGADFSQSHDLADTEPARLSEMKALFDREAVRNNVYPLDDRTSFARMNEFRSQVVDPPEHYIYHGKNIRLTHDVWPAIFNRGFAIDADIAIGAGQGDGVIAAVGSMSGGWSFFLKDGRPHVAHAFSAAASDQTDVAASVAVPTGRPVHLRFAFAYDGGAAGSGGMVSISIDGNEVARQRLDRSIRGHSNSDETFDIGLDSSIPVSPLLSGAGEFAGRIDRVEVQLAPMLQPGLPPLTAMNRQ